MSEGPVAYARVDGIALLRLSSPKTRNALSAEVMQALCLALRRAVADQAAAVVLTGSGEMFCAGGDLATAGEAIAEDIERDLGPIVDDLHELVRTMRSMPMPVVAAVNGPAIGAGISLAMAADVRVMAASAYFLTGYIAVGASPDGGASYHLARAFGASQALSHFLLNRRFTADQLEQHGLVDEVVVEPSAVFDVALALAKKLSLLSMPAVQAMRDLVFSASRHTLDDHLDAERTAFLRVAGTDEFAAGVAPFLRQRLTA